MEGTNKKIPIDSMPDSFKFSADLILREAEEANKLGIRAIALFPNIGLNKKDKQGSEAINPDNLVCRTVKLLKENFPELGIICDVALDPYTTHGHDGLLINNEIKLVINTTKTQGSIRDSYSIRRTSLMHNVPYYTTIAGARVAVDAIYHLKKHQLKVKSLQSKN